jgi:hypothetical protein
MGLQLNSSAHPINGLRWFAAKTAAKTSPRIQASVLFTILRHEYKREVLKIITGSNAVKIIFGQYRD